MRLNRHAIKQIRLAGGSLLSILVLFLLAPAVLGFQNSELPGRFFEEHSTWYEKIPDDPALIRNSDSFVGKLVERTASKSIATSFRDYSVPIWYADEATPLTEVNLLSDPPVEDWKFVPIPSNAYPAGNEQRLEGKYRDGWMVVISHDRRYAWDFYQAVRYPEWKWQAKYIRRWDLSTDGINQPYDGMGMAHVSPTPLLHGVITFDEIKSGRINHAIGFAADSAKKGSPGVYPCEGINSGRCLDDLCMQLGFRLQLDPSIDVSSLGLNSFGQMVARALQEYGMIFIVNNGPGETSIYAESLDHKPETWQGIIGSLGGIPLSSMRVVEPIIPTRPDPPGNLKILGFLRDLLNLPDKWPS